MFARGAAVLLYRPQWGQVRNMATLKDITRRLKSIRNIQKITKSMKMVAAAKYARAERELKPARVYGVGALALYEKAEIKVPEDKKKHLIVGVSSDRGLCGAIHTSVAKTIKSEITALSNKGKEVMVVGVGDKLRGLLQRTHGEHFLVTFKEVGRKPPSFGDASVIALELLNSGYEFDEGSIIYNRFRSVISYRTDEKPFFSLDTVAGSENISIYDDIDADVLRNYQEYALTNILFYSLKESTTSEQSARMTAMDSASKNASEMIDKLTLTFNRTRQAVITKELIEIISGRNRKEAQTNQEIKKRGTPLGGWFIAVSTSLVHHSVKNLCPEDGRTDPILDDVGDAFQLMGVNLHELEDYIHNIEPVTFAHQIPSFPVSKNNVLQFPQPGSKDAEERKEYIPDYMPPIVSSQEEEEEEQVPTDGGTSAEAMQVPLEEEGDMEDDEAVNDENFMGKRPLESPDTEEMPAVKRPKLALTKADALDGVLEPREPLSSINTQKVPPMLSPVHVQDSTDLAPPSPEPPMLAPIAKSQMLTPKTLETKPFVPKAKVKTGSPGQKTKSPKATPSPVITGSPLRSPKPGSKEKKSPGRAKSPKSPKSPKVPTHISPAAVKPETPSRTPLAALSEKMGKENIQVKQGQTPPEPGKPNSENQMKKVPVMDKTIDDSIDAVIARACAEREPDPFEFSSGSESEGEMFTSPKRLSISETTAPKASVSANNLNKIGATPLPLSGGTSSSDISWTMDDSIDEVIRKANMGTPSNPPASFPYFSSPSASPPTPEPLLKVYEEKTKLASSVEVKKKLKKELRTKLKKKEKQKDKEKNKEKSKDKDKNKEKDKDKEGNKEAKFPWKELLRDDDLDPYKFKLKDFEEADTKMKLKDGNTKKEREKHKDKKKDKEKGKKDKDKKDKEKLKDKDKGGTSCSSFITSYSQTDTESGCWPRQNSHQQRGSKAPVRSVVTETVSTYVIRDEWGNQIWICPGCNKPDDGSPMIGCDDCDDWYHWPCVGITTEPPEETQWFCSKCANKKKDKKHKKRKHRAH
ncbi:transcription initiation factor TFIID subunit 3 isoform B [Alligator mississippiensis]|uniref:ATP synthase F(1) complex subunit gamma, mitochondrial n=1 Tax=Alligator mississippiensis TaxID=8496 RepID=A0A151NPQ9_ALLMI|nr:transcription initiation factor TFIID subunit 3 isoform B [Alligator mississippiensis]